MLLEMKHLVAANQNGAIFGRSIVDHDGYFGAFDVGGKRTKILRGAVQLAENAVNGAWPVILGGCPTAHNTEEKYRKENERQPSPFPNQEAPCHNESNVNEGEIILHDWMHSPRSAFLARKRAADWR
jgi:hypothetical protein